MLSNEESSEAACRVAGYLDEPAEIDAVVDQLCTMESKIGLDRCIAIGGLVLQRFFGGSAQVWRTRCRNKNNSVRRIAQHPSCPLSRSSLGEAIGVYVCVQELPFIRTAEHIGPSHVAAVLRLSTEHQQTWLKQAALNRWTVRELRDEIQSDRLRSTPSASRPKQHPCLVMLRRAVRAFDRAVSATSQARNLSSADLEKVKELTREVVTLQFRLAPEHAPNDAGARDVVSTPAFVGRGTKGPRASAPRGPKEVRGSQGLARSGAERSNRSAFTSEHREVQV